MLLVFFVIHLNIRFIFNFQQILNKLLTDNLNLLYILIYHRIKKNQNFYPKYGSRVQSTINFELIVECFVCRKAF